MQNLKQYPLQSCPGTWDPCRCADALTEINTCSPITWSTPNTVLCLTHWWGERTVPQVRFEGTPAVVPVDNTRSKIRNEKLFSLLRKTSSASLLQMRHRNNMNNVFETRSFDILFLLMFCGRKVSTWRKFCKGKGKTDEGPVRSFVMKGRQCTNILILEQIWSSPLFYVSLLTPSQVL